MVETQGGAVRLKVRLNAALDDRVVVAEFGWWEDCPPLGRDRTAAAGIRTRNINAVLRDDARDPVSGSVPLRAIVCDIRRDGVASRGLWSGQRRFVVGERRVEADNVVALSLLPRDGGAAARLPARPARHDLAARCGGGACLFADRVG